VVQLAVELPALEKQRTKTKAVNLKQSFGQFPANNGIAVMFRYELWQDETSVP
jgi:hypothetical protein